MPMISTDDLKRHMNLTTTDDDSLIADKIRVASEWVSSLTGIPADIDPSVLPDADGDIPDTRNIPAPVKEAVRQLAAHLYENREAVLVGGITAQALPFGFLDLIDPYRQWAF